MAKHTQYTGFHLCHEAKQALTEYACRKGTTIGNVVRLALAKMMKDKRFLKVNKQGRPAGK